MMHSIGKAGVLLLAVGGGWFAQAWWTAQSTATPEKAPTSALDGDDMQGRLESVERQQRRQFRILSSIEQRVRGLSAPAANDDRASLDEPTQESEDASAEAWDASKDAEPSPEESAARAEAERLLTEVRRVGTWTDVDSHRLEEQLRHMDPNEADATRRAMIAALNRGELEVEFSARPAF